MTFSYNNLLPNDKLQAMPADIGSGINPKPVVDKHIEVDVAPKITIPPTDFKIVIRVL